MLSVMLHLFPYFGTSFCLFLSFFSILRSLKGLISKRWDQLFYKRKEKFLYLRRNNLMHQSILENTVETTDGNHLCTTVLVGMKLNMIQQRVLAAERKMVSWASSGRALPAGWGRWSFFSSQCWWRHICNVVSSAGLPKARETWAYSRQSPTKSREDD